MDLKSEIKDIIIFLKWITESLITVFVYKFFKKECIKKRLKKLQEQSKKYRKL